MKRTSLVSVRNGVIVASAAALLLLAGYWEWRVNHAPSQPPAAGPVAASDANPPQAVAATRPEFQKLAGKWLRPDGGYVLEIKGVDNSGRMDAAYFNPQPINISKAVALQDGAVTKVYVELRDVNYPGSSYTLAYDPANDHLQGVYYQAVEQQNFEIAFERMK